MSHLGSWKPRRRWVAVAVVVLVASAMLLPASATDFRSGQEVTVAANEVIEDDVYLTGETVTIDGTVLGDVVAAGRLIQVNGRIEGDLIAGGQAVVVKGTVTDDVRIAGQALQITGTIGDDLVAAGFSLETGDASSIGGVGVFAGFQALVDGSVGGDLHVGSQGLELRGTVGGSVDAEVGADSNPIPTSFWQAPVPMPAVRGGLLIADGAAIEGDLTYRGPGEAQLQTGAQVSGQTSAEIVPTAAEPSTLGGRLAPHLKRFVALLVVGALLLWLGRGALETLTSRLRSQPLSSLGWGAVGAVGVPALALVALGLVILLVVVLSWLRLGSLGAPILLIGLLGDASLVLALFLGLAFVGQVVVALGCGSWLLGKLGGQDRLGLVALTLGLLLFALLRALPFLGWPIGMVVAFWGFGTVIATLGARLGTRQEGALGA